MKATGRTSGPLSLLSSNIISFVGCVFVDDTDLCLTAQSNPLRILKVASHTGCSKLWTCREVVFELRAVQSSGEGLLVLYRFYLTAR
jgi:hypothetical protein